MGLKDRLRRLERAAQGDGIVLRLRDGTTRVFEWMEVQAALYLAECDLLREESRENAVLNAVRKATPESRSAFEERFGPITKTVHIIASREKGAWVEVRSLLEDGTVTKTRYEGGSAEAERIRRRLRA